MIKVNLLEGTAEQRVSIQKTKVVARRGQQLFMLAAALLIFVIALGIDHLWTNNAFAEARSEYDIEKAESDRLDADRERKTQLEADIKQVDDRIDVIKKLRAEQKGPVALLSAINERMPKGQALFQLTSITQKGDRLKIVGITQNDQMISEFSRQLEFSNGLFSNMSFSVVGKELKEGEEEPSEEDRLQQQFQFTIECQFNKPRAESENRQATTPAAS